MIKEYYHNDTGMSCGTRGMWQDLGKDTLQLEAEHFQGSW